MKVYAVIIDKIIIGIFSSEEIAIERLNYEKSVKRIFNEGDDCSVVEFKLDKKYDTGSIVF